MYRCTRFSAPLVVQKLNILRYEFSRQVSIILQHYRYASSILGVMAHKTIRISKEELEVHVSLLISKLLAARVVLLWDRRVGLMVLILVVISKKNIIIDCCVVVLIRCILETSALVGLLVVSLG
ncbi:hypothetical protein BD770DRAFT_432544 [Pilaira anomala]|nr:hypothetical protein BD770DRAFT_432544 [Pilaira anomala]